MKRALLPSQRKTLTALGENIKLARLRRELSSEQVAERAGISRNTLTKIERGEEGVAMSYYFRVLAILGLEKDCCLSPKTTSWGVPFGMPNSWSGKGFPRNGKLW